MKITLNNGRLEINGQSFFGSSVSIKGKSVTIDGVKQDIELGPVVNVTVHGDCQSIENESGDVMVSGCVGSIRCGNGDVHAGDVTGNVQTGTGDVRCAKVAGSVRSGTGDIRHG